MVAPSQVAQRTIDTFHRAADLMVSNAARQGNVVNLPSEPAEQVLIAGDLHGHRPNFRRILKRANLTIGSRRHLILQEVCHGGPVYPQGFGCMSHLMLEDVARLIAEFPTRVHFLLSNHELAELTDFPISKGPRMLNLSFRAGMYEMYGSRSDSVRDAAMKFVAVCPLAVRLSNGVIVTHSIPDNVLEFGFDASVLTRTLTPSDIGPSGDAFRLVWGRDYREANVRRFCELAGASFVVHGHERCPEGVRRLHGLQIMLDCCGDNACVLELPVARQLSFAEIEQRVERL